MSQEEATNDSVNRSESQDDQRPLSRGPGIVIPSFDQVSSCPASTRPVVELTAQVPSTSTSTVVATAPSLPITLVTISSASSSASSSPQSVTILEDSGIHEEERSSGRPRRCQPVPVPSLSSLSSSSSPVMRAPPAIPRLLRYSIDIEKYRTLNPGQVLDPMLLKIMIKLLLEENRLQDEVNFLGPEFYMGIRQVYSDHDKLVEFVRSPAGTNNAAFNFTLRRQYTLILYYPFGKVMAVLFKHSKIDAILGGDPLLPCVVIRSVSNGGRQEDVSSRGLGEMFRRFLNIRHLHEYPNGPEIHYRSVLEFAPDMKLEVAVEDQAVTLLHHIKVILSRLNYWYLQFTLSRDNRSVNFPWPFSSPSTMRQEWKLALQSFALVDRFVVTQFTNASGCRPYLGSLSK